MKTLFHNCTVVAGEGKINVLENGAFIVENDTILSVGKKDAILGTEAIDQSIDLKGGWVIPGFVNTHGHAGMAILRGIADDMPLKQWLETKIWPLEQKMNEDFIKWSTSLAMLEMVKSGTTTFLDMYHPLFMDQVGTLVEESRLRAVIMRGMIGLCSKEEQQEKLSNAVQFVKKWHGEADGRITTMLAPHSLYTCPPEFLKMISDEAIKLNIPIHTHMSETVKEVEDCIAKYGKRPAFHLADNGIFQSHTLVAHAVHVNDEELDLLVENKVAISHNPMSNLKLGSGIANIDKYMKKGLLISLGTDSVASNNNLDMFEEMRMASLLQKGIHQSPESIQKEQALKMATANGARALKLHNVGSIETGKKADFFIIHPDGKPHLYPKDNVLSHLIYSASGKDVSDVYVDGQLVVKNGECLTMDEEKIMFEAERVFNTLCI
jgi:5-methylthioadenosine/S-adenosylhomocysteine deaminase